MNTSLGGLTLLSRHQQAHDLLGKFVQNSEGTVSEDDTVYNMRTQCNVKNQRKVVRG